MMQYSFGVEAIKHLMGSLEDIRRLDMAMVVASGEVDSKWLNLPSKNRPKIEPRHTGNLCRTLILWGWSRPPSDVMINEETEQKILEVASRMGKTYSSQIPLVELADQRLKIARLATAAAIRSFSSDGRNRVIVRACHVEFVEQFLNRIYSSRACGYKEYSAIQVEQREFECDRGQLDGILSAMPNAATLAKFLLEAHIFLPQDVEDWTSSGREDSRIFVGELVRAKAIRKGRKGYFKTQGFVNILRDSLNGLTDETAMAIAEKEDF